MKRYEYKLLFDRVTVAMGAQDFNDWVFKKLNEWGAEGWQISQYNTPMAQGRGSQMSLTGELVATGCREITAREVDISTGSPGYLGEPMGGIADATLPVVEGLRAAD